MQHSILNNSSAILRAREEFLSNGRLQEGAVTEVIERSWRRCLASGVDAEFPRDIELVSLSELAYKREQHRLLLEHAQPEMETLNEQMAHKRSVVVLTDNHGVIMNSLGGHHFLGQYQRSALMPGASWHEEHRGTNAIGTALVEKSATSVWGAEHFMAHHHEFSCAAVPIFGARNELMAILDVSNDFSMTPKHTLALVKMAAQMIENRLFCASQASDIALHFHARPEFIGTLWQGIAMFSEDGWLMSANRSGQFQFNMVPDATRLLDIAERRIHFDELFQQPFSVMSGYLNGGNNIIFPLRLQNGGRLYAHVETLHKTHKHFPAVKAVQTTKRSSAASLDLLDSGDAQVARAIQQIKQVVSRDIPILIQGETGAGKELFARAIHAAGPRHEGPWIAVNCAALPEGLIEAELFGYEEGAFTGAKRKGSLGKIEQAHGGTLFLDEIGDMPLSLQARLLRVLQERTVTPLGSTKSRAVDFSLVTATNQKLREKAESGEFRSDLYYRINGLSISLPPLRKRTDLPALIDILLEIEQAGAVEITPEVSAIFQAHPWPGNIRQLHNVLRTALALADGHPVSTLHLPQDFLDELDIVSLAGKPLGQSTVLEDVAADAIRNAMKECAGNISEVARQLGISRNTLYRKLKAFGLA